MTPTDERTLVIVEMRLAGIPARYIEWLESQCSAQNEPFSRQARMRLYWWNSENNALDREWKVDVLERFSQ